LPRVIPPEGWMPEKMRGWKAFGVWTAEAADDMRGLRLENVDEPA
jgi:hypothetical protein